MTTVNEHTWIIGEKGVGKSTLGEANGRMWFAPWYDTDHIVEEWTGRTPGQIIAEDGEEQFRTYETLAVRYAAYQPQGFISTGGGVPLRRENREIMRQFSGHIVYLYRKDLESPRHLVYLECSNHIRIMDVKEGGSGPLKS